jgi:hypothetical protein
MSRLAAHGVSVDVPAGWEAELSTQPDPATLDPAVEPSSESLVVLHIANFSLPVERGDYGSGAVETMDSNGIFVTLVEFDGASATSSLFADEGVPVSLAADDFAPDQLNVAVAGQAGLQQFFHVVLRAFCLYAVIGSYSRRRVLVAELNRVLAGLSID